LVVHKSMIFFSLHYPFHFTDSYLDEEINELSYLFNKVIIVSANTFSEETRPIPANAVVYRYTPCTDIRTRIRSLSLIINPAFYQSMGRILFRDKMMPGIPVLKELFAFYARAAATEEFIEKVIWEQQLDTSSMLIYTYWMIESSLAAVLLKQRNPAIKVISRAHSQDVYFARSPVKYHPFRKYIFERLDHLYFISANAMNYFIKRHGITDQEKGRISISRIGIHSSNAYLPKQPSGIFRLVSVAYIQRIKRVDLIIDALALIDDIKIEWYHAGHSNKSHNDFEAIQQYAAKKLSGKKNISFSLLGKTGKEELFKLYATKEFDCFINVSETEGIPVSMMEAMSYSVPVIGSNVGGVSEIVEHERNGYLLSPYPNATEVANTILKFARLSQEQRETFRKNAYTTWNTKYNAAKNNIAFVESVTTVIENQ